MRPGVWPCFIPPRIKKKTPETSFFNIFRCFFLSRTFVKGRKNYKRKGCKCHCVICGYESRRKTKKKNQEKIIFQVDILHFVDILLNNCENTPIYFPF